jgi:hypothetical protein
MLFWFGECVQFLIGTNKVQNLFWWHCDSTPWQQMINHLKKFSSVFGGYLTLVNNTLTNKGRVQHLLLFVELWWHPLVLHCSLHSFKVLHNKWCSPHFIMWNKTIERINEPKKKGCIISSMFFMYIFFWLKTYFHMCFDHLIKFYASHLLKTRQMI